MEMCMPAFLSAFVAATMYLYHNKDWKKQSQQGKFH